MTNAIDVLMSEHRTIESVLGSLETFVKKMESGVEDERATLRDYTIFFLNFADEWTANTAIGVIRLPLYEFV